MITGHTRFMASIFLQMYLAHFPGPPTPSLAHTKLHPHQAPPTPSSAHTKAPPGSESFHHFLKLINAHPA